jgi:hypothetical protein
LSCFWVKWKSKQSIYLYFEYILVKIIGYSVFFGRGNFFVRQNNDLIYLAINYSKFI